MLVAAVAHAYSSPSRQLRVSSMSSDQASSSEHRHPRVEDDRLTRGAGRFVDDLHLAGEAHACFIRSPHAHAKILSIDAAEAHSAPGVLAVLTSADMTEAKI